MRENVEEIHKSWGLKYWETVKFIYKNIEVIQHELGARMFSQGGRMLENYASVTTIYLVVLGTMVSEKCWLYRSKNEASISLQKCGKELQLMGIK